MPTHPPIKLPPSYTFITLPNSSSSNIKISNFKLDIKTTSLLSQTIRELVHSSPQCNIVSYADVYCIPCRKCKLKPIGEMSQKLQVRLKEYKREIRVGNVNNELLQHISQSDHNFDFNFVKMLIHIHNKRLK